MISFIETASCIGTFITAIASIVAVFIAKKTLSESMKDQRNGLIRSKKQATLETYKVLQEEVLSKINQYRPQEIKEICEENNSEEYKTISGYLARIELFCVGITDGIYDLETFYKIAHGYFDGERGMLKVRILPILETKLRSASKDYFKNIHEVWELMDKKSADDR